MAETAGTSPPAVIVIVFEAIVEVQSQDPPLQTIYTQLPGSASSSSSRSSYAAFSVVKVMTREFPDTMGISALQVTSSRCPI